MSKTRDLLLQRQAEIKAELARVAEPLMDEYKEVKRALDALNSTPYRFKFTPSPVVTPQPTPNSFEGTDVQYNAEMENFFGNWDCPPDTRGTEPICHVHSSSFMYDDNCCDETCKGCHICRRGWDYR